MKTYEVNFDGLVGPTHNYAGLSYGNIASTSHKDAASNPKLAALQGLEKMLLLYRLGLKQAVFPPHERPDTKVLKSLGFNGTDEQMLHQAAQEAPGILSACSSAAAMWTANAGTVTPSSDTDDGLLHLTPANLSSKFHRAIEAPFTHIIFKTIFQNEDFFKVHPPLPSGNYFSDEGAANHTRFCKSHEKPGVHFFVYGRYGFKKNILAPLRFPGRQTEEAFEAIRRNHRLDISQSIFAQQNPQVIDQGVFHNDVISVGNESLFFFHEAAFVNTPSVIDEIERRVENICGAEMKFLKVTNEEISVENSVKSYLFNSQILTLPNGETILLTPAECQEIPAVKEYLTTLMGSKNSPFKEILSMNLKESMQNGGGPACLRLRVVMNEKEIQNVTGKVFFDDKLYERLKQWVEKHYRDTLHADDLADPALLQETRTALDELTKILNLGSIYPFQR